MMGNTMINRAEGLFQPWCDFLSELSLSGKRAKNKNKIPKDIPKISRQLTRDVTGSEYGWENRNLTLGCRRFSISCITLTSNRRNQSVKLSRVGNGWTWPCGCRASFERRSSCRHVSCVQDHPARSFHSIAALPSPRYRIGWAFFW